MMKKKDKDNQMKKKQKNIMKNQKNKKIFKKKLKLFVKEYYQKNEQKSYQKLKKCIYLKKGYMEKRI